MPLTSNDELDNTIDELNITTDELNTTKDELHNTISKLNSAYLELSNTRHKLTVTDNQLSSALQRIGTLEMLMSLSTEFSVAMPTSNAAIMESSLRWSVKLVAMAKMSESFYQQCPVILRLPEFNERKKANVPYYSVSFYTHNSGYKMCLRIDPAGCGDGRDTHLSLFLCLMKGPHDDKHGH